MDKGTIEQVRVLEDLALWLRREVADEEMWAMNADANGEIICRKLKKAGLLKVKDGYYKPIVYHRPSDELVKAGVRER